ncbi:MAG: CPBP family glutamic-type intramembrane protease [Acidiferrobacterales bacterium]
MGAPDRKKTIRYLVVFAVLVNAAAWIGRMLGGDPTSPGIGFLLWGTAPILVSVLMRAVTRDWSDLGARPEVKFNIRWYFVSLLAYPFVITLVLTIGSLLSATSISGFSTASFIKAVLPALVTYFFFAIFEEVGWRGYLAPKMYSLGINIYLANALVAVVWASWHLPYIVELSSYTSEGLGSFLPRFYLGAFAFSLVYGEIRIRTGSFWPAVLMHWMGNAIANPLVAGFVTLTAGREYLGSIGVDGVFMIVLFGFWGVMLIRQRHRDQKSSVLH